ncbi:MAG: Hydroxyacylglutathione hydrolase [Planctomycetes bacterium]|nr:Hydroxyacylglutathione hydrolase [Planctomycetota bacterium]
MSDPVVMRLGPAACRPYLVGCPRTKAAMLIDPLREGAEDLALALARDGWDIVSVVDTHTHADHVSGGRTLAEVTGAPYLLHERTESSLAGDTIRDGQTLRVGDVEVSVLHTPGHTPDSVSLVAGRMLFTGDALFLAQDGAGRLDLPGGDPGEHWDSLRKLAALGDDVIVLPGHDYQELESAPLAEERIRNPRFQDLTREEYVLWQRAVAQPTPAWMLDVIAKNLGVQADSVRAPHGVAPSCTSTATLEAGGAFEAGGGACQAAPGGRVPTISVSDAAARRARADAPFLLDVREPFEFRGPTGRHAPGAVLVPLASLPSRLAELAPHRDREVLVICKSGGRSARAAEFLISRGFRRVFNVAGGTDAWAATGLPVER